MSGNAIATINGPVVTVRGARDFQMLEMVQVGHKKLVGEVISTRLDETVIQVYEDTAGLRTGEPVTRTGAPVSALLGPGLLRGIYDGIARPLREMAELSGAFLPQGGSPPLLDEETCWALTMLVREGDELHGGDLFATCPETEVIEHRFPVPPGVSGTVVWVAKDGEYRLNDPVLRLRVEDGGEQELTLCQRWPIKQPRPVRERLPISRPLITGQRVIDTLFPVAKGGAAAVPGGFGTGKTMTQHQLAKWCDADIIVYIGCGERGNEMTQVLEEFSSLIDPKSGKPLTERTILIANTSNMPVAAREASIYTGVTLAEYYRDMGYHVAIMADSTSRWAEALREISGRLEEMPAEEGFPAYLPSRLSGFYERAGYVRALSGREGSLTIIGAVSPQGADFSEPVTQNTKRFVRSFWALDKSLAYARHYPAINWTESYSEYLDDLAPWYEREVGPEFAGCRARIGALLLQESELMEVVKLIGEEVLPDDQRLIIETARLIRVGFLQQNAFHAEDTFVPMQKQLRMMQVILHLHDRSGELVAAGVPLSRITGTGLFTELTKMKYDIPNNRPELFDERMARIDALLDEVRADAGAAGKQEVQGA